MGIRSATNIRLLKRGNTVAMQNATPTVAAPSLADRRRAAVAALGTLPSFDIPVWAAKKLPLSERLLDYFGKTKLFSDREWKNGILVNILENPAPNNWDSRARTGYDNKVPFEIYPKGRKKEGRVTGFLQYSPNVAPTQTYPSGLKAAFTELTYEDGARERVKVNGQWTPAEEAGWKKFAGLVNYDFTTAAVDYKTKNAPGTYQLKPRQMREALTFLLARDFTGTDGSEIRVEGGNGNRNYQTDYDANGGYAGYHYNMTFTAHRARRRSETEVEVLLRESYNSNGGTKYEVVSVTKMDQP